MITELVSLLSTCVAPNIGSYGQVVNNNNILYTEISSVSSNVSINSLKLLVNSFTCDLTFNFNMKSFIYGNNGKYIDFNNYFKQVNYVLSIPYDGSLLSYCNSNDYLRYLSSVDIALKTNVFNFPNYQIASGPAITLKCQTSIALEFNNPTKENVFSTSSGFQYISNDFIDLYLDNSYSPNNDDLKNFLKVYDDYIVSSSDFSPTNAIISFKSSTYHSKVNLSSYNKLLVSAIYENTSAAYNEGYQAGYNIGVEKGINGSNPFSLVFSGINNLLSIEIFPNFKLIYVVGFGLFVGLVIFILGFFK